MLRFTLKNVQTNFDRPQRQFLVKYRCLVIFNQNLLSPKLCLNLKCTKSVLHKNVNVLVQAAQTLTSFEFTALK